MLHGFPDGSEKNPPANAGDAASIPRWRRFPGEGNGNPLQYSLPGKSCGQGSLVGYSPWGRKRVRHELATTTYCLTQWLPQFTFPPTANAQSWKSQSADATSFSKTNKGTA